MKAILLASALMIGGVAYAQADPRDAGQPIGSGATMQPGTTMGERDTMGPQSATPPAPAESSTMTAPMPADAAPPPPPPAEDTMTPPPPADMNATTTGSGTVVMQQGGNMTAPPADTGPYPRCTRAVTDHCQQSSARESDTKGGPPKHRRPTRR